MAAFVQGADIRVGGIGGQLGKTGGFRELWPEAGGSMQTPASDIRGPSWDEGQLPSRWTQRAELGQRVEPPQEGACCHDSGCYRASWGEASGAGQSSPGSLRFHPQSSGFSLSYSGFSVRWCW